MNYYLSKIFQGMIVPVLVIMAVFLFGPGHEPVHAQMVQIMVPMSGAQEVPPVVTPGTGLGTLNVDLATGAISGTVTFSGLTTPTTAGHIHIGDTGVNGPVIIPLVGGVGTTAGTMLLPGAVLLPEQLTALLSDGLYLNIHTMNNPGGEIRGQILP